MLEKLYALEDLEYKKLVSKLTPNISMDSIIGVRIPEIRKLAKESVNTKEAELFLNNLPHKYYDENILHGSLLSEIKDYDKCIEYIDKFLPYIDNWAVCDTLLPKVFKKNTDKLIEKINVWIKDKHIYTVRFAISMLMRLYLDDNYDKKYLNMVSKVKTDEYYLKMMVAWYFATALAKRWDDAVYYLENNKLDTWIHNKTITKACDSFRITDEQKEYLRKLKR